MIGWQGSTDALIRLRSLGVHTAICPSQTSMTLHLWRERGKGWAPNVAANGSGALLAGAALLVVAVTKFAAGAWARILLIPVLVPAMLAVRRHYGEVARKVDPPDPPQAIQAQSRPHLLILPVVSVRQATVHAVSLATAPATDVRADAAERMRAARVRLFPGRPLEILPSPYRSVLGPVTAPVRSAVAAAAGRPVLVVIPEVVPHRCCRQCLHNPTALLPKGVRLFQPGVAVVDVPYAG